LVPYIIKRWICVAQLDKVRFPELFDLFIHADLSLQTWIERYFTSEPAFIDKICDHMEVMESLSMPFFMLIFKAMQAAENFDMARSGDCSTPCQLRVWR
jgi:hypothetical protein